MIRFRGRTYERGLMLTVIQAMGYGYHLTQCSTLHETTVICATTYSVPPQPEWTQPLSLHSGPSRSFFYLKAPIHSSAVGLVSTSFDLPRLFGFHSSSFF